MPTAEMRVPNQLAVAQITRKQKDPWSDFTNMNMFGFPNNELDRINLLKHP
jgi:hypothetical protein